MNDALMPPSNACGSFSSDWTTAFLFVVSWANAS
jgi:hypothetical protein